MSLTRLFVARPTLVFVLVAVMLFAGALSTATIVKQLFPNVNQPTISIAVSYNGASVTEMRDNIVAPIEQNLAGTTDLQTINSVVQQGRATVSAVFAITSDTATDLALTQKAIQSAEKQLPTNLTPPTAAIRDPSESTVATLGVFSRTLSPGKLSLLVDNVVAPRIEQIPGVSFANVAGDVTPAYEVEVDPTRMVARGVTLNDLISTIGSNNARVPGGIVYEPGRETTVDVRGDVQDVPSLRDLPLPATIASTGGTAAQPAAVDPWTASDATLRLGDVANVVDGIEPRRQYAQVNTRPGLILQIQKASTASEVDASNAVLKALPALRRQFPAIAFSIVNTQSKFTQQQIDLVTRTILEGVVLTGVTMLFFLRSWRNALVVCVSIPTSLAITLTVMRLTGLTIDTISLLGMSLVIGILVDDSTVVLENIERHHRELGAPPERAAIEGREEIGAAAVVITLVDVVVFLPIVFVQGQVGRNLSEFAIVVVISTLTSLFVSFTVTPTLAGLWALRSEWKPWPVVEAFTRGFDRLRDGYVDRALPWALRNGGLVAAVSLLSFVGSVALVPLGVVGEEFIPPTDRGQIFIQLAYPLGTPLERVKAGVFALEREIRRQSDVDAEIASAGGYSASFGGYVAVGNAGQVTVYLKDDRKASTDVWVTRFTAIANRLVPAAHPVVVASTGSGGGNAQPIDFLVSDVSGGDPTPVAQRLVALLKTIPGAIGVSGSGTDLAPQISIGFDRRKAAALDVDLGDAAAAAGAAFGGAVASQFETTAGLEQIQVIYPLADQTDVATLKAIPLRARSGGIVHLGDVATLTSAPVAPLITRTDRLTVIHVNANVAPGASLSNIQAEFVKGVARLRLPASVVVKPAPLGQQDFMRQALLGLGGSLVLSVILVFLLMVALYNSYRDPFIILFSIPVAAVGALLSLVLTHKTLNLYSLIGTILLVGVAAKNGILLVDYANALRGRGASMKDAIVESARTRFRPIVMTSFSVVAGNLPLALALEPGSSSRASLGIVVIGGVLSSLLLTLLLVPGVYLRFAPRDAPKPAEPRPADPPAGAQPAH